MGSKCLILGLIIGLQGCLLFLEDPEPFPEGEGGSPCQMDAAVPDAWLFMYSNDAGASIDASD